MASPEYANNKRNTEDPGNSNHSHLHDTTSRGPGSKSDSASPVTGKGAAQLENDVACVRLDHLESRQKDMKADIKDLSNKMDKKFESVENKFDKKFESMENKFDKKFEHMTDKIDKILWAAAAIVGGVVLNIGFGSYKGRYEQASVVGTRFIPSSLAPLVEKSIEQRSPVLPTN
ncbi:hypothetical protein HOY80DRAFT_1078213 [Tuber brumale]|nr:hypothetical protein HOY80DRAFT_1078213 [Tuber brumale]